MSLDERQGCLISVLASERWRSFRRELRDKLTIQCKVIELQSQPHSNPDHEPLHLERPFGLPVNFHQVGIKDVWEKILKSINVYKDVCNLREVCCLFRDILEEKYRIGKLLKAVETCFIFGERNQLPLISKMDALNFRLTSRTAKVLFDKIFTRASPDALSGIRRMPYLVPCFHLDLVNTQGRKRLRKMVESIEDHNFSNGTFALRTLNFDERKYLHYINLRGMVERLLELAGENIRFLTYISKQSSHETYGTLRRWVLLLPNLEELTVGIWGTAEAMVPPFEPFPRASRLTAFHEDDELGGFSLPHLGEILRANPGIRNLIIAPTPENRMDVLLSSGILHGLSLQVFRCSIRKCTKPILECQFSWPLKTLRIGVETSGLGRIPSKTLFNFLNNFGATLKELMVDLDIKENGGMLELPNLTRLMWWLGSATDRFDFVIPLRSLKYLYLAVPREFADESNGLKRKTMEYLESFHVPQLFPALRMIEACKHSADSEVVLETIWKCHRVDSVLKPQEL